MTREFDEAFVFGFDGSVGAGGVDGFVDSHYEGAVAGVGVREVVAVRCPCARGNGLLGNALGDVLSCCAFDLQDEIGSVGFRRSLIAGREVAGQDLFGYV